MSNFQRTLICLVLIAVLLTGCKMPAQPEQPEQTASVPDGVQVVEVSEEETVQREIIQKKEFDQCASKSSFKAEITFSDQSSQESSQALVLKGTLGGELGLSQVAKVTLEGAVEKHFGTVEVEIDGREEKVVIDVPGSTRQEYTLVWRESRREGAVRYIEDGQEKEAQYSYRVGLEMVRSTVNDLACPNAPAAQPLDPGDPPVPTTPPAAQTPVTTGAVVHVKGSGMGQFDETDSDQYVQTGDLVSVTYISGEWWIGKSTSSCNGNGEEQTPTDANGYLDRDGERVAAQINCDNPNKCRPLPSAPWGGLLGRIGKNGALFYIGNQLEFVAQDSGLLYLRMNYSNHNDVTGCPYGDGGKITVRVKVTPQ